VFFDLEVVGDRADREADLGCADQRPARHTLCGFCQTAFGRGKQLLALAGALGGNERVATDDQALAGVVGACDLGQVGLVRQRTRRLAFCEAVVEMAGGVVVAEARAVIAYIRA